MINKLPAYSSYTDTDIDWIEKYPSHWQLIPCRAVVDHIVEKNEGGKIQNYLSLMANVGVIRYEDKGDVGNKKPEDLSKCKIVKKGQLVINSMNYSIGSYGMSPYDGVCSSVYIILEPKKSLLNRYCLRVFENSAFQKHLATFGNGILAHRAAIGWDDIKGEYIPLAPMDEQKNIINFLDHETAQIDTLIEKQQTLIQLLKEKRQAVISHAVTKGLNPDAPMKDSGVEWLGEVPEHWDIVKLSYKMKLLSGDGITSQDIEPAGSYAVYGGNGLRGYTEKYNCNGHYVLIGRQGALCGNINLAKGEFFATEHAVVVYPYEDFDIVFLSEFLRFMDLGQYSVSAAQPGISVERINGLKILVPSYKEQIEIGKHLSKVIERFDALSIQASQQIELLQERRTALISAAVTGKIDVRGWRASK
uniref:restriction endonuclease subunit S n=1 Tax=uncultured Psychrobacter sp. TaxID=259303 RepID=UPI002629CEDA|nr:restriction endonuclease subunit S [uncultured Psychrobacter sp.]